MITRTHKFKVRKLAYVPEKPLVFKNGKALIYKHEQTLLKSFFNNFGYISTLGLFSGLLYTNPCICVLNKSPIFFQPPFPSSA